MSLLLAKMKETLALTDFEIKKLFRQKKCYAGLVVVILLTALCLVGFYMHKSGYIEPQKRFQGRLVLEFINGVAFSQTVFIAGIYMILPMVVGIMAAGIFAGEYQNGHLRTLAIRPVSRLNIMLSKFLCVCFYSYFLLGSLLVFSYLTGAAMFGLKGDVIIFGPIFFGEGSGVFIMPADTAFQRLFISYFFSGYSLISLSAMFVMFSIIFRNIVTATIVPLGVYYTSYIVDALPFMESIQRFLPTRYLMIWKHVMADSIMWDAIFTQGCFLLAYTILYMAISTVIFKNADI